MQIHRVIQPRVAKALRALGIVALVAAAAAASAQPSLDLQPDGSPARVGELPGQGQSGGDRWFAPQGDVPQAVGPTQLQSSPNAAAAARVGTRPIVEPRIALPTYKPNEFERYVNSLPDTTDTVRRFGTELLTDDTLAATSLDPLPSVPADYVIKPGDEVALTLWGSVDASLRLVVGRSGDIAIPRIGAVGVGGLHYRELADTIRARVGQLYHDFQLSATLGQVGAVRLFVTGYAQRPGSITVSGLASVLHAVMRAGGPSAAGSYRDIRLTRGGKTIASYDLYQMLLNGSRAADQLVQPDDIIFIGPILPQVAILGSVNQPGIFEVSPSETIGDLVHMAGGFTSVADSGHLTVEHLADRLNGKAFEVTLPQHVRDHVSGGDVYHAASIVASVLPQYKQNKRVHVDGEVVRPGDYVLAPGSTLDDAIRTAGGLTPDAFPFGTVLTRNSVRKLQQANYDRALRELEADMARSQATQRVTSSEEAASRTADAAANKQLLERLRDLRPSGRIVLEVDSDAKTLPNVALESGDSITVPGHDESVGVFGSVFSGGSFLFKPGHDALDYLRLAGGPTRGADKRSMFVVRANGAVVSAQQGASFWHGTGDFDDVKIEPGDTIFVPEEMNKSTFVQDAKDWTQILYQFGLGIAGLNALSIR